MAIFGVLKLENLVQVGDKTRLDATKTYVTSDEAAITLMEIETDAAAGFVDITSNKHYNFQYTTDGDKVVTLRVTTDGSPESFTKTLSIISAVDDKLFSSDAELISYEPNILNWVKEGRNSFLDIHREAQIEILKYLDNNGYHNTDGSKLTKANVVDIAEFSDWSKFMVLKILFESLSNATDDIFHEKALRYRDREYTSRDRSIIRVDLDEDGTADVSEEIDLRSIEMIKE